ncbi:MAG TPA: nuclear transport factor 2 family protein [Candidatus Limnocylindrales bacterium]|nr:nuclear transport factor 2 family protein [Candidatus Limnocylindrales bacterium]
MCPTPGAKYSAVDVRCGHGGRWRAVDAFNRRDAEAFAALLTPDVEVVPMRAAVEGTSYRGRDGVAKFFAETDEIWDAISVEMDNDPTQVDDEIIFTSGRLRGRGHDSGADVEMELAWVLRFRDGLISSFRTYTDAARARKDAGLSE